MTPKHAPPILLVDDSPEDREATLRAFRRSGVLNPVHYCQDGEEALDFLHHRGAFTDPRNSPRPGIILLDLNLPGTDGREVLRDIKENPALRAIPVIVLTSSSDERDVKRCYEAGANTYIQKPVDLDGFFKTIDLFQEFWLRHVILPTN